jgi:hypothetical protein
MALGRMVVLVLLAGAAVAGNAVAGTATFEGAQFDTVLLNGATVTPEPDGYRFGPGAERVPIPSDDAGGIYEQVAPADATFSVFVPPQSTPEAMRVGLTVVFHVGGGQIDIHFSAGHIDGRPAVQANFGTQVVTLDYADAAVANTRMTIERTGDILTYTAAIDGAAPQNILSVDLATVENDAPGITSAPMSFYIEIDSASGSLMVDRVVLSGDIVASDVNLDGGPPVRGTLSLSPKQPVAGDSMTLTAPEGAGYEWYFNAQRLSNGSRVAGANSRTLTIADLRVEDSGAYYAVYDDGLKAPARTAILDVVVAQAPPLHVAGPWALGATALALAAAALTARRRRRSG